MGAVNLLTQFMVLDASVFQLEHGVQVLIFIYYFPTNGETLPAHHFLTNALNVGRKMELRMPKTKTP